ncbi:hypothetical protein ACQRIU_001221 [Beauveria bassiana]
MNKPVVPSGTLPPAARRLSIYPWSARHGPRSIVILMKAQRRKLSLNHSGFLMILASDVADSRSVNSCTAPDHTFPAVTATETARQCQPATRRVLPGAAYQPHQRIPALSDMSRGEQGLREHNKRLSFSPLCHLIAGSIE